MKKIILVVVVLAAVYFIVRGYARAVSRKGDVDGTAKTEEDMVRCLHCGVHLPRSEGLGAAGKFFCSEEHQRLHGP